MTRKRNLFVLGFAFFISLNGFAQNKPVNMVACPGNWSTVTPADVKNHIYQPTLADKNVKINFLVDNYRHRTLDNGNREFCVRTTLSIDKIVNGKTNQLGILQQDVLLDYTKSWAVKFENPEAFGIVFKQFIVNIAAGPTAPGSPSGHQFVLVSKVGVLDVEPGQAISRISYFSE